MVSLVPLVSLIFLAVACSGSAYQLEISSTNICVARGNGTCFDLQTIASFPVKFSGPGENPSVYEYTWDPCAGVLCKGNKVAMCQLVRKNTHVRPATIFF
jgi:hypothetical protein